jgi:hypothetical protein
MEPSIPSFSIIAAAIIIGNVILVNLAIIKGIIVSLDQ